MEVPHEPNAHNLNGSDLSTTLISGYQTRSKKKGGPSNTIESLVDIEKLIIWKKYMEIINIH